MIEQKIIIIPQKVEQIVQRGNDIVISMIYRFYDAESNSKGQNEYIDVNVAGEGFDKDGWSIYKALSGAYKYAITQTFAIPTVDDAEKSKTNVNVVPENNSIDLHGNEGNGTLNENEVEQILGAPSMNDYEKIFELGA